MSTNKADILDPNNDLAATLGVLLVERGLTLAAAESCSGGLLADRIISHPGSSAFFLGSLVTYSNAAKVKLLGVEPKVLEAYGAVSEQTALQMASGARKQLNADYAVAITGVAGPDGGSEDKPVGLVWIAVSDQAQTRAFCYNLCGARNEVRASSVTLALDLVRKKILECPMELSPKGV